MILMPASVLTTEEGDDLQKQIDGLAARLAAVEAGWRAGPSNTGHRLAQVTDSSSTVIAAGETRIGQRFPSGVRMSGGTAIDCDFTAGLTIMPGSPVTVAWSTIRGGMAISSASGGRFSHLDIRDTKADTLHITSDRGALIRDVLFDTCWLHGFQPLDGAHADGVQVRGVDGLTMVNCTIDLGPWKPTPNGGDALNAAFFTQTANGGHSNIRLRSCYLNGGGITWRSEGICGGVFEVTDCDFGPDWHYRLQYTPSERNMGSAPTMQSGNRYLDRDGTWQALVLNGLPAAR